MLVAAMNHHRAGRLRDAEQLYRQILSADRNDTDALRAAFVAQVPVLDQTIARRVELVDAVRLRRGQAKGVFPRVVR